MKFLKNVKTDEFMATVTRTASKYGYKLKKASPTIMIFGAAAGQCFSASGEVHGWHGRRGPPARCLLEPAVGAEPAGNAPGAG